MKGVLSRLFVSAMTFMFAEHGHPGLLLFNGLCSFSCLALSGKVQTSSGAKAKTPTTNTELHVSRKRLTLSLTKPFIRQSDRYIYSSLKISQALRTYFFQLQLLQLVGDKVVECGSVAAAAWVLALQQDETSEDKNLHLKARSMRAVVRTSIGFSNLPQMESLKKATYMNH